MAFPVVLAHRCWEGIFHSTHFSERVVVEQFGFCFTASKVRTSYLTTLSYGEAGTKIPCTGLSIARRGSQIYVGIYSNSLHSFWAS